MPKSRQRLFVILGVGVAAGAAAGWYFSTQSAPTTNDVGNSIVVIKPYHLHGTWVFDDPAAALKQEPFVAGVPEMIDHLVREIPNARAGFRLLFSAAPFPGHQAAFTRVRGDIGGTWYRSDDPPMEGWLCPALFKYYKTAPKQLFVKAEAIKE